jgi:UDP-3-O-[3-hydroxymyristoyl] glucosamine N-acyltransferase
VRVFVHPQAICETTSVGPRTRIWAFAHVLPGARIGADCNICDHTFIENDVTVGDRVTVKCGVQLWDGVRIEDDVFIGPNATFANDRFPRSKRPPSPCRQRPPQQPAPRRARWGLDAA